MASESKPPATSKSRTVRIRTPASAGLPNDARPSLLVVQGAEPDLGRIVPCEEPVVIGRDARAGIPLHDVSISREHCRVEPDTDTGGCTLVDLGSTNGTRLNRHAVRGRVALEHGDKIFLGVTVVRFAYVDDVELDYYARLEDMASTDPVTGLFSRRRYEALYDIASQEAVENGESLAVMVVDVDGLKSINDTHGHEMGAFTIAETARVLRGELEKRGILARFGGDELVGCFPGVGKDAALSLAEAARAEIEESVFTRGAIRTSPTISIGVAAYPGDADEPSKLFEAADRALYRAKREGRNRIAAAEPISPAQGSAGP